MKKRGRSHFYSHCTAPAPAVGIGHWPLNGGLNRRPRRRRTTRTHAHSKPADVRSRCRPRSRRTMHRFPTWLFWGSSNGPKPLIIHRVMSRRPQNNAKSKTLGFYFGLASIFNETLVAPFPPKPAALLLLLLSSTQFVLLARSGFWLLATMGSVDLIPVEVNETHPRSRLSSNHTPICSRRRETRRNFLGFQIAQ